MSDRGLADNGILARLTAAEQQEFLNSASPVPLPAGSSLFNPGEPYSRVLFPTCGIVSAVSSLADGQLVEIAAIGREGMVGLGTVLGVAKTRIRCVVQIDGAAYQMPADKFIPMFHASSNLRSLILAHAGRLLNDIARSACCNRFHSHRQRLARWLVVTMRKSDRRCLELTHDFIAQMVGGPRHLVSTELAALRALGALEYQRGAVTILDESKVIDAACECVHFELGKQLRALEEL